MDTPVPCARSTLACRNGHRVAPCRSSCPACGAPVTPGLARANAVRWASAFAVVGVMVLALVAAMVTAYAGPG